MKKKNGNHLRIANKIHVLSLNKKSVNNCNNEILEVAKISFTSRNDNFEECEKIPKSHIFRFPNFYNFGIFWLSWKLSLSTCKTNFLSLQKNPNFGVFCCSQVISVFFINLLISSKCPSQGLKHISFYKNCHFLAFLMRVTRRTSDISEKTKQNESENNRPYPQKTIQKDSSNSTLPPPPQKKSNSKLTQVTRPSQKNKK